MTLTLTVASEHGVWASADHRLVYPDGTIRTNKSPKHLVVSTLDGHAIITYTGLGEIGTVDTSRWLRGIIRGDDQRSLEATVEWIRDQASRSIGASSPHIFVVAGVARGVRFANEIRNIAITSEPAHPRTPQREFRTFGGPLSGPAVLIAGQSAAVSEADRKTLDRISHRRPSSPEDYMTVLANVNARASRSPRAHNTVSESCSAVYLPNSGRPVKMQLFGLGDDAAHKLVAASMVTNGIDLTESALAGLAIFKPFTSGQMTQEEAHKILGEGADRSVRPRRPL